jgi:signal transduction histidine kinase
VVASVRRDGDLVSLQVADRGLGVPADRRERVFERFARSDSDRPTTGGSGLGLAIVRAVAEAHSGHVALRDAEGGGALFEVSLTALGAQQSPVPGVVNRREDPATSDPKGLKTT